MGVRGPLSGETTSERRHHRRWIGSRAVAGVAALGAPVLAVGVVIACGSTGASTGFGGGENGTGGASPTGSANNNGGGAPFGQPGTSSSQPSSSSSGGSSGGSIVGDGGNCDPNAPDLVGCACQTGGSMRACYSGPSATRGIGSCHDGMQTCSTGTEFHTWGPCQSEVIPNLCDGGNGCEGPSYCTPPRDAATPMDVQDAQDELPPNCHYIMGGVSGFFDGSYYCEGNLGGLFSGLFGGGG